jgi:hypothetical protein
VNQVARIAFEQHALTEGFVLGPRRTVHARPGVVAITATKYPSAMGDCSSTAAKPSSHLLYS